MTIGTLLIFFSVTLVCNYKNLIRYREIADPYSHKSTTFNYITYKTIPNQRQLFFIQIKKGRYSTRSTVGAGSDLLIISIVSRIFILQNLIIIDTTV